MKFYERFTHIPFMYFIGQVHFVEEGFMVPWWLGACWHPAALNGMYVAPIPLNYIYWAIRWVWQWAQYPWILRMRRCPTCGRHRYTASSGKGDH